jgi:hypothetical protein
LSHKGFSWRSGREFAFHGRKDTFDQAAAAVAAAREVLAHLLTITCGSAAGEALGGDNAFGVQLFPAESVIALRVKLRVGQYASYGGMLMGFLNQSGQTGAIVPRSLPRTLGQYQLPFHVDHDQPLQPMTPRHRLLRMVMHATYEKGTHGALRQPGGVDGYRGPTSPPPGHAPHDLLHHPGEIGRIKPQQKTIEGGVVRDGFQLQSGTKLCVFTQPDFGLAEGPVFVTHQAEHS